MMINMLEKRKESVALNVVYANPFRTLPAPLVPQCVATSTSFLECDLLQYATAIKIYISAQSQQPAPFPFISRDKTVFPPIKKQTSLIPTTTPSRSTAPPIHPTFPMAPPEVPHSAALGHRKTDTGTRTRRK